MPFGLPFIARPGQEGFDQYGRMIPPEIPDGWDGWGRPIVPALPQGGAGNPPMPPNVGPAGGGEMAGEPDAGAEVAATRDMAITEPPATAQTTTGYGSGNTGRPTQPECFDRPPARADSFYRFDEFDAFALPAQSLNRAWELHLPRELVSHDVNEADWAKFIDDLAREALTNAPHNYRSRNKGARSHGPHPVLSDTVHSLLASWAVAFFSPRGIKVYAASDGTRIVPPPLEPPASKRGYSAADEWTDDETETESLSGSVEEAEDKERRRDVYLPRRERELRRGERARKRRREKRAKGRNREVGDVSEEWEVCFVCATPTIWTPGARPRTYGEPLVRSRR